MKISPSIFLCRSDDLQLFLSINATFITQFSAWRWNGRTSWTYEIIVTNSRFRTLRTYSSNWRFYTFLLLLSLVSIGFETRSNDDVDRRFLFLFLSEFVYDDIFLVWETIAAARRTVSKGFVLFIALAMMKSYRDIILDHRMDFTDIIKFFNGSSTNDYIDRYFSNGSN